MKFTLQQFIETVKDEYPDLAIYLFRGAVNKLEDEIQALEQAEKEHDLRKERVDY